MERIRSLDLDTLRAMYNRENTALEAALLSGAAWNEVKDHQEMITLLSEEIYKKLNADTSPRFRADN